MEMGEIIYRPIGIVRSPFKEMHDAPRQAMLMPDTEGVVEIFPDFAEGLKDIGRSRYIVLVCHFHLSTVYSLMVKPPHEDKARGVFASRSPNRPNPIGISVVRLVRVEKNKLHIKGLDVVDGTPVLDIKPYFQEVEDG